MKTIYTPSESRARVQLRAHIATMLTRERAIEAKLFAAERATEQAENILYDLEERAAERTEQAAFDARSARTSKSVKRGGAKVKRGGSGPSRGYKRAKVGR